MIFFAMLSRPFYLSTRTSTENAAGRHSTCSPSNYQCIAPSCKLQGVDYFQYLIYGTSAPNVMVDKRAVDICHCYPSTSFTRSEKRL